ncbi:MAG: efflux RND transporter periplasmic adaptor subunit [Alphaproteobacteria bacterium]|nr:MAG: efflux RND transporter periplasmic adaptor subunit [Alphaproteobacteria bacterium]
MFSRRKDKEPKRKAKGPIIRASYVWAVVFTVLITGWMLSGQIDKPDLATSVAIAEQTPAGANEYLRVQGIASVAQPYQKDLTIRGRTSSLRTVFVRSETAGRVAELPIEKGTIVKAGDVLCQLEVDARAAQLEEAKAIAAQRKLEWQASEKLLKQGHRSRTQNAGSKAAYESALAYLKQKEVEIARTEIRAPFDGVFNDRQVEVGDYVQPGQVCGSVVDQDPYLVVAQISEQEVGTLIPGSEGHATLISGETVTGHIRYVSTSADPATRTFRVELEVDNPNGVLRDGVTADLSFPLQMVMAHKISPAVLGLDARGVVGVRTVDEDNIVAFAPVDIIADTGDGVWVAGLPEHVTIITRGQELVQPGQKVDVTVETPSAS